MELLLYFLLGKMLLNKLLLMRILRGTMRKQLRSMEQEVHLNAGIQGYFSNQYVKDIGGYFIHNVIMPELLHKL